MSIISNENICVTTTAMPRPELIEKTYESFTKNIPWLSFKKIDLYLNIDLFPSNHGIDKREEVISIAKKYFGNVFVSPIREPASFPLAVKWLFSQVNKEFVLNIEDDWLLLKEIPKDTIENFFEDRLIVQVGLRAWRLSDPRFVLSPSFIRSSFCNMVAKHITAHKNPEMQIRSINPYDVKKSFIYWPYDDSDVILQDTGRSWIKNTKYVRGEDGFVRWHEERNEYKRNINQNIRDQNLEI